MNDEQRNQLTSNWRIPKYARDQLWVEGDSGAGRASGEFGEFELPAGGTSPVTIYWRDVHKGAALVRLPWRADSLDWDGGVRIGGYVDAMHITNIADGELTVAIIYLGGQPLRNSLRPYDTAADRETPEFMPSFHAALASDVTETISTWIAPFDSPLTGIAQDAMQNNMRLHCFGRLADESSGWDRFFALPIILESMTVFGS